MKPISVERPFYFVKVGSVTQFRMWPVSYERCGVIRILCFRLFHIKAVGWRVKFAGGAFDGL